MSNNPELYGSEVQLTTVTTTPDYQSQVQLYSESTGSVHLVTGTCFLNRVNQQDCQNVRHRGCLGAHFCFFTRYCHFAQVIIARAATPMSCHILAYKYCLCIAAFCTPPPTQKLGVGPVQGM